MKTSMVQYTIDLVSISDLYTIRFTVYYSVGV